MSPKRIIVQKILCTRSAENSKNSIGFQISGYKEINPDLQTGKVGFILSGVKVISFQQAANMGIRTRVKWITKGFEIREEIHPLDGIVVDLQRRNNIIFVNWEDDTAIVMQGEPIVQEKSYRGQIMEVKWSEGEIHITPLQNQFNFHCILNPRNSRIDCLVK